MTPAPPPPPRRRTRSGLRLLAPLLPLAAALVPSVACFDDDPSGPPVELASADAKVSVTLDPFQVRILDPGGGEVLRTLKGGAGDAYGAPAAAHDDAVDATRGLPGWDGYAGDERAWAHGAKGTLLARTPTSATFALAAGAGGGSMTLDVSVEGAKVKLHLRAAPDPAAAPGSDGAWNKTTLAFALRPDDHFFGLGERFASVDHRGLSLYSWPEEGGLGKGEGVPAAPDNPYPNGPSMTYYPVPFFLSSAGYAMHLATTYRTETHFGSERPDAWRVAANATDFEADVYVHADPLASLDDFTRDTGRPMVPATWVFGPVRRTSWDIQVDGVDEYLLYRQRDVPTTTIDDSTHFLPSDSQTGREDVLRKYVADVHAAGYKIVAYNNPYVAIGKDTAKADADYGTAHGLFATNPDGSVATTELISGEPLTIAELDLTKPEAVAWFQGALQRTIDMGYDGWMHDFGEYTRRGWRFADGRTGEAVHNEFPVLSAKAAHDLWERVRPGDYLFYVRSGYTGSAQYAPAVWGGDAEASFDETQGIPASLRGGLNLGLSGVAVWGSDVTGFKCLTDAPHDKEMVLRWAELGAVSPFMIEENACSNPIDPSKAHKWKLWDDDETVRVYGDMARLHTRLAPYFEVLVREANRTGAPITRHPFLYYPREPEAWKAESSFFLGPSLFASPVVARGATSKETWLPPGRWVDVADSIPTRGTSGAYATYDGGARVTIPAPLDEVPLLLKDGGIVPLLDASIQTLGSATDPSVVTPETVKDRLDVLVALSREAEARITLADGTELVARRKTSGGASSGLAEGAPETIATCQDGCFLATEEGSVDRLRVTTPLAATSDVSQDDLELHASGPSARRIRWDVLRLR